MILRLQKDFFMSQAIRNLFHLSVKLYCQKKLNQIVLLEMKNDF